MTVEVKRTMIESGTTDIPVSQQCKLLKLSRSSYYYRAQRDPQLIQDEWQVLHAIDTLYTASPHLGRRGMSQALDEEFGLKVNPKRVRRLMAKLGLSAIYPKPRRNTSTPNQEHTKYPYLLREINIDQPDQVWCADITYIPLYRGFAYLVAVMDWHTRCVLGWSLSNTMDSEFCVEALEMALHRTGRKPAIFNTDQGSQFTSELFTGRLIEEGITISMDGVGRAFDNIMIERLWRSVKYEDIYLRDYQTPAEVRLGLRRYLSWYNHRRRHSGLEHRTPGSVYGLEMSREECKCLAERLKPCLNEGVNGRSITPADASATVALRAPSASVSATDHQRRVHLIP